MILHRVPEPSADPCWAHHDSLGRAVVRGADGGQRPPEEPPPRGAERGGRQRQAVQLRVGAFPEGPVDQRSLPLEGLLLSWLCTEEEQEEVCVLASLRK